MSTTAWNGVHFRTIVVCQNWRKQPHTSELISSFRGACTYGRVSLFTSVPSNLFAFTCAGALTPTRGRGTIGNVVQRSSVAPQSGDKKIHRRQKNHRRKDRPQIQSFRANNYRINYSGERALSSSTLFTHTRVKRRGYTDNGAKERPLLGISRGTRVRLIRARQI